MSNLNKFPPAHIEDEEENEEDHLEDYLEEYHFISVTGQDPQRSTNHCLSENVLSKSFPKLLKWVDNLNNNVNRSQTYYITHTSKVSLTQQEIKELNSMFKII